MKLLLTSSGNTNKSIEKALLELLGKPFGKVRLNFLEKLAKETPNTFYAIDDNTAVKVVNGRISIISEGKWKKFN